MAAKPNVQVAASVDFLGVDLVAGFEHVEVDGKARDVLIAKQLNMGDEAQPMKVAELADRVAKTITDLGGAAPPPIQWPDGVEAVISSYDAYVKSVYLKIERAEQKTDVEYALFIGIGLDDEAREKLKDTPPFNLLMLKDLYLKIWSTDNAAVLREMNFVSLEDLGRAAPRLVEPKAA